MDAPATTTYRFGEFEVDVAAYSVRRGGQRFDSLGNQWICSCCCWSADKSWYHATKSRGGCGRDVFTDLDAGIRTAVLKIRRVLGDSSESPQLIETVPGKGYRFIAHVEVEERSTSEKTRAAICIRDLFGCASPQLTHRVDKLCGAPERAD